MCGQFNQTSVWYPDDDKPKLVCEMFDKGATTFDLQDTTFHHPEDLFDRIKNSHLKPYVFREERNLSIDSNTISIDSVKTGRDLMYEQWEKDDQ